MARAIGIDLGTYSVKAVELTGTGDNDGDGTWPLSVPRKQQKMRPSHLGHIESIMYLSV